LSPGIATDPYHVPILNFQLTRNLNIIFPEIREGMILAFEDAIPLTGTSLSSNPIIYCLILHYFRLEQSPCLGHFDAGHKSHQ
jgi:hypothetical protein